MANRSILAITTGFCRKSIRQIASLVHRSKSSVHRHIQAINRRNIYPESSLWETPEGEAWLRLMVIGSVYHFGIGCGVGAGKLSDFFHILRIEDHLGVSESSVQKLLKNIESLLPEFQKLCEESVVKKSRKVVVAMDETFFGQFMIMVVIDLKSGYLLLEDIADDRCYSESRIEVPLFLNYFIVYFVDTSPIKYFGND